MSATATATAVRSVLRSSAVRTASTAAKSRSFPKPSFSPFRSSKQRPLSHRILRNPVEMSFCLESMLPYHTATASALLTSMLSVSRSGYGWTLEGQSKPR